MFINKIMMSSYIGRFAPTPSGCLHFGSLVTALASFLDAKANNGKWLVRIEDLDKLRSSKKHANQILQCLNKFELYWDDDVIYQSMQVDVYQEVINKWLQNGLAYACSCSRSTLQGQIYDGSCQNLMQSTVGNAIRLRVPDLTYSFADGIYGTFNQNLAKQVGDFIIKRRDGFVAYHLACVIDDASQKITHIVRGADLLDSTLRQLYVQELLNLTPPNYAHVPLVVDKNGRKLSKSSADLAIDTVNKVALTVKALEFLGQNPPPQLYFCSQTEVIAWATHNWQLKKISCKFEGVNLGIQNC